MNPNVDTRDAVVLAIRSRTAPPEMQWRTAFGGTKSERGWGIAGSTAQPSDVYLVGGAASQAIESFPLKEFSTTSTLDYYQSIMMGGSGGGYFHFPWSHFEDALDFESVGSLPLASPENSHQGSDAFIASFDAYHPVGIDEASMDSPSNELLVTPLPQTASWTIHFPYTDNWSVEVYDAVGRQVRSLHGNGKTMEMNLGSEASGLYMLRAVNGTDTPRSAKVVRP
jgi:hypothetical protein